MKTIKRYALFGLFLTFFLACNEDVLEIKPDIKINSEEVFLEEDLARAYLANVYGRMPFLPFNSALSRLSDEATLANGSNPGWDGGDNAWDYSLIRDINVFIERMSESSLDES